jgi:glycerol uptake facilitator-like aquaporin
LGQAIGIELVLTFFLMSAVFGTAVSPDAPRVAGFGIGLVLLFDILVGGPLTGAAMNPARAFGPALVAGQWLGHVAYWVGPILGALLAALLWQYVLLPKTPTTARRRKSD